MRLLQRNKREPGWLAITITDCGVGLAHVRRVGAVHPQVLRCEFHPTPSDDPAAWRKLRKEAHCERYRCTTLLGSSEYQMLQVEAPNVPSSELKSAIRWRINDILDYPAADATLDVLDIPPDKNAPAQQHSVYAIAARNQFVERRQAMFEQAKIPLAAIDIPELAQRNIAALFEQAGRALALLAFDENGGLLTFTANGELHLARRIEVTLAQLQEADEELRRQVFDRVVLEVQRSLDHFDRHYHHLTLSRLLLAPLPGNSELRDYLTVNLYVAVESLDLSEALDFSAVPELADTVNQAQAFYVLGAALRDEEPAP